MQLTFNYLSDYKLRIIKADRTCSLTHAPGIFTGRECHHLRENTFKLIDKWVRPLLYDQSLIIDQYSSLINIYDDHTLPFHQDTGQSSWKEVFVIGLIGKGNLMFVRGINYSWNIPEDVFLSIELAPGDVLHWTCEEEKKNKLYHGGKFNKGRMTLALRYLHTTKAQDGSQGT